MLLKLQYIPLFIKESYHQNWLRNAYLYNIVIGTVVDD